jgi:hypothetical protein
MGRDFSGLMSFGFTAADDLQDLIIRGSEHPDEMRTLASKRKPILTS